MIKNTDAYKAIKEIEDKSIDLIITDPPYKYQKSCCQSKGKFTQMRQYYNSIIQDNLCDSFDYSILDEFDRVMKKINIYIWCSLRQISTILQHYEKKKCNCRILCWQKTDPIPLCKNTYLKDLEFCIFAREAGVLLHGSFYTKKTLYSSSCNHADKALYSHPTIKPLKFIQNMVINSSVKGDTVLDPFMGSGTTGVASEGLKRRFIGFEINPRYYEIAKQRLQGTIYEDASDDLIPLF